MAVFDCNRCLDRHSMKTLCIRDSKTCPKCGHFGPIDSDFGLRILASGNIRAQSHCRTCRGGKKVIKFDNGSSMVVGSNPTSDYKAIHPLVAQEYDRCAKALEKQFDDAIGGAFLPHTPSGAIAPGSAAIGMTPDWQVHTSEIGSMMTREQLKTEYHKAYKDSCTTRSWKFMANKLGKKLGVVIVEAE